MAMARESVSAGALPSRLRWMDLARGIAILLVIAHHAMALLARVEVDVPELMRMIDAVFAPFRMPLLVFLSGMLVTRALAKPTPVYFGRKARGLLWPYLIWSLVVLAVTGGLTFSLLRNVLYYPPTFLWYLWFLFVYYAIAWAPSSLRGSAPAGGGRRARGGSPPAERLPALAIRVPPLLLPARLVVEHHRGPRIPTPVRGRRAGRPRAGDSGGGAVRRRRRGSVQRPVRVGARGPDRGGGDRPSAGTSRRWSAPLEYTGRHSIVYYVSHYPVIVAIEFALASSWPAVDSWVVWAVSALGAVAVGCLLAVGRSRVVLLRWLFEWPRRSQTIGRGSALSGGGPSGPIERRA